MSALSSMSSSLSMLSQLERDAVAGLLQLQIEREPAHAPAPSTSPVPTWVDTTDPTHMAAWILTQRFRRKEETPAVDMGTHIVVQTTADVHAERSPPPMSIQARPQQRKIRPPKRFTFDSPGSHNIEDDQEWDTSEMENLIREAMLRRRSGPARQTSPVMARHTMRGTLVQAAVTSSPNTIRRPSIQPRLITDTTDVAKHALPSMKRPYMRSEESDVTPARRVRARHSMRPDFIKTDPSNGDSDDDWHPSPPPKVRKCASSGDNKENCYEAVSDHEESADDGSPGNRTDDSLVPIGNGNARIPRRVWKTVNWGSYTTATRRLLTAVFPRSVLATHSLTGKPSPAFPNKPAKKKLDPSLVNDIVQAVVEGCGVAENIVRTSITTKCADESKMLRTRMRNRKIKAHSF